MHGCEGGSCAVVDLYGDLFWEDSEAGTVSSHNSLRSCKAELTTSSFCSFGAALNTELA